MKEQISTLSADRAEVEELTNLFKKNGDFTIKPYSYYQKFKWESLRLFMHITGLYSVPTQELIDFLKSEIEAFKAIEIGCGMGSIARALKIPPTDSRMQERPDIKLTYTMMGQPVIQYPDFVEKYEAIEAVRHYKPDVVIGSYITMKWNGKEGNYWGVHEPEFMPLIKKYIHIGSLETHKNKPLMKKKHTTLQPDWLIVRGKQGFIGIW